MSRKKRTSKAGRTAKGHIKKGYRLTKGGKVVKASKKRR
jgi:hypothetical protein